MAIKKKKKKQIIRINKSLEQDFVHSMENLLLYPRQRCGIKNTQVNI